MTGNEAGDGRAEIFRKWEDLRYSLDARRRRAELRPPADQADLLIPPDMSTSTARWVLQKAIEIDIDAIQLAHPINAVKGIPLADLHDATLTLAIEIIGVTNTYGWARKKSLTESYLHLSVGSELDKSGHAESINLLHANYREYPLVYARFDITQKERDNMGAHHFYDIGSVEKPKDYNGPVSDQKLTPVMYKTLWVGRQWMFNRLLNWEYEVFDFPDPEYPPGLSGFLKNFS